MRHVTAFVFPVLLVMLSNVVVGTHVQAAPRPNILLILADDVGWEVLGSYGGTSYRTPELDRLSRAGMRFRHCYSMPMCHPTRICLLTGRYPLHLGHPQWGTFPRPMEGQTVGRLLQRAGYRTAVAGKWQLTLLGQDLQQPHRLGFDPYCLHGWHEGPKYYGPLIWQNGARREKTAGQYGPDIFVQFLIDFMERNRRRPFFAFYPMVLCHAVTNDLAKPVAYGPRGRYDSYAEMVAAMDARVGRLIAALDRLKLREKTLVLFVGDNGTAKRSYIRAEGMKLIAEPVVSMVGGRAVRGGKGSLTDGGTHVPLIANWPRTIRPGQVVDDLVDMSDFLPTLAALAGAPLPAGVPIDGHSFAPLLNGTGHSARHWAFAEGEGKYWVRTQRWKLYDDGRLFDLDSDPNEKHNLAARPLGAAAATARALLQRAIKSL